MLHLRKTTAALAIGCAAAVALSGCTSGGPTPDSNSEAKAGGTLHVLNSAPAETWDPQRINITQQDQFASRVFSRTLTTPTVAADGERPQLVGDLATDTGTATNDATTWTFTIRDDVFWQDGEPVTCDDVKYGIARNYASELTGSLGFAMMFLDIPTDDEGSAYKGPYSGQGQELFDHAVSCDGSQITFNLSHPAADFNEVLAMQNFAPYREDLDEGAKGLYSIFSNGPYMIEGEWASNDGATFVRNPQWTAESDPVRKAYPDQIVYVEGLDGSAIDERMLADAGDDKYAVSQEGFSATVVAQAAADPAAAERLADPPSPYVDYLAPNYKSPVMSNPLARQALAMSTDRGGYILAHGGPELNTPLFNILNVTLPAHKDFKPFGAPANGDPEAAREVLEESGLDLPVPITVTYLKSDSKDKALAALAQGWEKAGFEVTLDGISENYYGAIASADMATKSDVFWSDWGAYWPSASSVLPQLFDSRLNLSEEGSGADPGYFDNPDINEKMDAAARIIDPVERENTWGDISEEIANDGGYIALMTSKYMSLYGSGVKNFAPSSLGHVDFAELAVR